MAERQHLLPRRAVLSLALAAGSALTLLGGVKANAQQRDCNKNGCTALEWRDYEDAHPATRAESQEEINKWAEQQKENKSPSRETLHKFCDLGLIV
jgi:hypothetical protein